MTPNELESWLPHESEDDDQHAEDPHEKDESRAGLPPFERDHDREGARP
jgi:hypothetical protein